VSQLLVAINKMDTVNWSQSRYDEIVSKLAVFLKQTGFKESDVRYVPCSGLSGENLCNASRDNVLFKWYSGPTLASGIGKLEVLVVIIR
jgi:elongation factor 1 alpha-like protein